MVDSSKGGEEVADKGVIPSLVVQGRETSRREKN